MTTALLPALTANLLSPAVLFFALGAASKLTRSQVRFPEAFAAALTIYLLVALGFKGGVAMNEAGFVVVLLPALAAIALGAAIPLWTYPLLRYGGRLRAVDAAAIAGHYGSVSAVTFLAATNYLKAIHEPSESFASAFLAVMESPAIVVGVFLGKLAMRSPDSPALTARAGRGLLHEALGGRSIFYLVGSLLVGALSGRAGMEKMEPFLVTPFQGVLALFLLEMGAVAGERWQDLKKAGPFLVAFGLAMPVAHAVLGAWVGHLVGLSVGGATLLSVLAASASYIAAPAAMRLALPEANPALSLTTSLAVTFPFNVAFGIPLYYSFAAQLYR